MGWEWSLEQSAHLALQEPQFRFDKLAAKKANKNQKVILQRKLLLKNKVPKYIMLY